MPPVAVEAVVPAALPLAPPVPLAVAVPLDAAPLVPPVPLLDAVPVVAPPAPVVPVAVP